MSTLVYALSTVDADSAVRVLRSAGVEAKAVGSCAELRKELSVGTGALVILEEMLEGEVRTVIVEHVAAQQPWSDLPILVLAKRGADSTEAQKAVEHLGNVTVLERPVRVLALITAVRSALRGRRRQFEVRSLNERKDHLLATLAHELRNPLAPISNAAAVLKKQFPDPQAQRLTEIIGRQTSHLTRLVDDLLDVARITSGKIELQLAPSTVSQVVVHALEIASDAIQRSGNTLVVKQPEVPVPLLADHVRLVQAVSNLLLNAAKFTPPKGRIELRVDVAGPWVDFVVQDSGRGIDSDVIGSIFEMFDQGRATSEPSTGLGLGLHLAKSFAEMHGGFATVTSSGVGQGSEFRLSLPIIGEEQGDPPAASVSNIVNGLDVLVVDDNKDAAQTLQALLSSMGAKVSVAYDGQAAVSVVSQKKPDVIIMDIGMPVMDGYEAARRIRRLDSANTIVLVALTGWGQFSDKARASEAGFHVHLVKPLQLEELLVALAAALTAIAPA